MTQKRFTYSGAEKLKSRKLLNQVFAEGRSLNSFPIKITYSLKNIEGASAVKIGVGASSRHFKKAVDRNRIKRLLREAYRLQKHNLWASIPENQQLSAFLLFVGKDLNETLLIPDKMKTILEKLATTLQHKTV